MEPLERGLNAIGLGTPTMRFAGIGGGSAAAFWLIKPELFFDKASKEPRPWSILSSDADATPLPWYAAAAGLGVISAVFL